MQTSLNYNINFYEDCVNPKSELYDSSIKPEYVYAYYFPQDKKLAELEGKNKWPVKIGKTTNDPGYRIKQQLSESTLNQPIICFVACVSNCTYYETELHRFYSNQHSKIQGDNGANEWFYINPEELEEIIFLLASPKENKIETFQTKSSLVKNSHDKLLSAQHILNISKIIPPNSLKIYLTLTCYSKALSQSEISTLTDITLSNLPKYLTPLLENKLIIKENDLFTINFEHTLNKNYLFKETHNNFTTCFNNLLLLLQKSKNYCTIKIYCGYCFYLLIINKYTDLEHPSSDFLSFLEDKFNIQRTNIYKALKEIQKILYN